MDAPPPNVRIATVGPCTAATVPWRLQGALNLTVVVKATFAFGSDGPMTLVAPEDLIRAEANYGDNPTRSVRVSSELAPSIPRADVLLTGHACAPAGNPVPALSVRLVVFRDAPLVDKAIHVRGDAAGADVAPFERMPLVYERAFGGPGFEENPYGRGVLEGGPAPNLIDPRHPRKPACFAPIPRALAPRRRLLGGTDRRSLEQPIAEIPLGFDWTYFQAAPEDQRTEYLHGNEWVVLERMTADPTFVRSHLPSARGLARISGIAGVAEERPFPLAADTLRIDADQLRCSVVWRRRFPVASMEELAGIRVQAAVQIDRASVPWPAFEVERVSTPPSDPDAPRDRGYTGTLLIEAEQGERASMTPAVPFVAGPANPPPPKARAVQIEMRSAPMEKKSFDETLPIGFVPGLRAQPAPPSMPFARSRSAPPPADDPSADEPAPAGRRFERESVRAEPLTPAPQPSSESTRPPAAAASGVTIAKNAGLSCEALPWGLSPSRDCFAVIAKATAELVPGGPAKLKPSEPLSDERFLELASGGRVLVYPSDRARFKVRADVVAIASAYPEKGTATNLSARFAFGASGNAFDRALEVFGDRRWGKNGNVAVASSPEPFLRMPLGWERAFGGKGYASNPVGLGVVDRIHRGPTLLPNVEDPGRRVRTPKQIVPPTSIAPVPLAWKDRAAARQDRREPWGRFPEELDWTHHQIAPPSQQLAFLRGDEPFAFHGMHRNHAVLEGALPGLRVRAFAASGERFDEVPLRLDTVVFTVDELKVDLVYRGALPVSDERAPPSVALHFLTEPVASPLMTVEEARAKLRRS